MPTKARSYQLVFCLTNGKYFPNCSVYGWTSPVYWQNTSNRKILRESTARRTIQRTHLPRSKCRYRWAYRPTYPAIRHRTIDFQLAQIVLNMIVTFVMNVHDFIFSWLNDVCFERILRSTTECLRPYYESRPRRDAPWKSHGYFKVKLWLAWF